MFGKEKEEALIQVRIDNATLTAENEALKARVTEYLNQIEHLTGQVEQLQRAIVAKESPRAYEDLVRTELEAEETPDWVKDRMEEVEAWQKMADMEMGPLFDDAEDMVSKLVRGIGPPTATQVHDNEES